MGLFADRTIRWLALGAVAMVALLLTLELSQADEPVTVLDIAGEVLSVVLLVGGSVMSVLLALRLQVIREESRDLRVDLQAVRRESRAWREAMASQLQDLGAAIGRQFEAWNLTAAEQEVGLLLLKGFSHKEIARLRRTSEATIRQQAAAIYQKADLGGRAALSAYFLDDILAGPVNGRQWLDAAATSPTWSSTRRCAVEAEPGSARE